MARVENSRIALNEFARRLLNTQPDSIVVISPHSPLDPHVFTARSAVTLHGDFADFGAPQVRLSFPNDLDLIRDVERETAAAGLSVARLTYDSPLDHGAMVPLYYLRSSGWRGPIAVFGFTMEDNRSQLAFGRAVASAASASGRRVAVLASGDLSHRLIVGGPYEYEPTAHLFDEQIVRAISDGTADAVINLDHDLRRRAGECGYRSILIALGAIDCEMRDHEVLSYEGPFGVGYMVAVLVEQSRAHD
jgi:aromatic ring-opening dioxygenase LigB subunit